MKDWMAFVKKSVNSDIWGFIALDYYYTHKDNIHKDKSPSQFIDDMLVNLRGTQVDIVDFHRVLLSVCVQLLGADFNDIIGKSIRAIKTIKPDIATVEITAIAAHYAKYHKTQMFFDRLSVEKLTVSPQTTAPQLNTVGIASTNSDTLSKIVFVVVNDTECEAITDHLKSEGIVLVPQQLQRLSSWKGRSLNGFEIWVVRSEMAHTGKSGATLTTNDLITQLSPDYMIMVGIAFGLKRNKQKLGELLVAKTINDYETSKIYRNVIIPRGEKPNSSSELLSKARMVSTSRKHQKSHFGEVLSGLKLLNDGKFIRTLKKRFPEALGGEMEGSGFAAACERHQISWLLVKGICDWGVKKNDAAQKKAAQNAVLFCLHLVKLLPQPNKVND